MAASCVFNTVECERFTRFFVLPFGPPPRFKRLVKVHNEVYPLFCASFCPPPRFKRLVKVHNENFNTFHFFPTVPAPVVQTIEAACRAQSGLQA